MAHNRSCAGMLIVRACLKKCVLEEGNARRIVAEAEEVEGVMSSF